MVRRVKKKTKTRKADGECYKGIAILDRTTRESLSVKGTLEWRPERYEEGNHEYTGKGLQT